MNPPKFWGGAAVFVKMRGYPPWPAKVEGIAADGAPNTIKYHVYFYGTNQIAVCKEEDICPYLEFRQILGKPKKVRDFNAAIKAMDEELGLVPRSKTNDIQNNEITNNEHVNTAVKFNSNTNNISSAPFNCEERASNDKLLELLRRELQLVNIEYGIQSSLNLKQPDPDECLHYLSDLLCLNISKLMLKKHPEIIYTLIKLQNYVGCIHNSNMTEDSLAVFKSKARNIRRKALLISNKIQGMFEVPMGMEFLEYFEEELTIFKESVKDMSLNDVLRLVEDPTNT